MLFKFTDILERRGISAGETRLLRHDARGLAAWRGGRDRFGCFASIQYAHRSPFRGARIACHFLPGPGLPDQDHSALFVGATQICDAWVWDGVRLPVMQHPVVIEADRGVAGCTAYDLEWLPATEDLVEKVLIRWGNTASTRAWSQWAGANEKEILELHRDADKPAFPGFSNFAETLESLAVLPQSWRNALRSVRGVYLLVCPGNGEQYVGSAYGSDGFLGRWVAYAENGHGGNVRLQQRARSNFAVSILEIASPDMAPADIIARESAWKQKLGARAHGLNAN